MKKLNTIITNSIIAIMVILLIFLLLQTNKLQNKIKTITGQDIIDITPNNKSFDLNLLQTSILNTIDKNKNSIASIYATKTIEILDESTKEDNENTNNQNKTQTNNIRIESVETPQGNGIVVSDDGYIITNKHVIDEKNAKYTIYIGDTKFNTDKIWYDELLDLAIIKVKTNKHLIPAKIINFENQPKIGSIVFALKKDPEQKEIITKMGIINSMKQKFKLKNNYRYIGLIQNSTAIEPGFSGGPLININGETIGINTAIDNIQFGASYALPLNKEFINQTISSIKESNKIIRPYLGLEYEKFENEKIEGIKIRKIINNSPGEKAGIKINDIIYGINNHKINYDNFLYLLYTYKPHKNIVLNIQRGEFKQDIQVTLGIKSENKK